MLVRDAMGPHPAVIRLGEHVRRAAEIFGVSELSHLMVVDDDGVFVGTLAEDDVLRAMLPRQEDVLTAGGSVTDAFRLLVEQGRALADRPIDPLVDREPVTVRTTDDVARAAVVLAERHVRRLPVVDRGALVGTLSRSDVCRAVVTGA